MSSAKEKPPRPTLSPMPDADLENKCSNDTPCSTTSTTIDHVRMQPPKVDCPEVSTPYTIPLLQRIESYYSEAITLEPNEDEMRDLTDYVVEYGKQYNADVEGARTPAWQPYDPKTVASELVQDGIPEEHCSSNRTWKGVMEMVHRDVITPGLNTASPGMFGYIPGGGVYPSALADYWAAVTNRFSGMFMACPGGVKLENLLIHWVANELGLPDPQHAGGALTSGGSLATISAFVCAREHFKVLCGGKSGDTPMNKFVVYMTDQTHSCAEKGLHLIGCGHIPLRRVPRDARLRMIPAELERMLQEDADNGFVPWLVVLNAGTTNCGSIDPLEENTKIAKKFGAWVHIDGAYGALLNMCNEGKAAFGKNGFKGADSIIADPHKSLFLPFGTGMLIVPNGELLKQTHAFTAPYLEKFVDTDESSPADVSSELSKHFRALRMYLPLRIFGAHAFRAAQSEKILLARYFHHAIREDPRFVAFHEPQLSIVMYRMKGLPTTPTAEDDEDIGVSKSFVEDMVRRPHSQTDGHHDYQEMGLRQCDNGRRCILGPFGSRCLPNASSSCR